MRSSSVPLILASLALAAGCGGDGLPTDDPDALPETDVTAEASPAPDLSAVVRERSDCPDLEPGLVAHDVAGTPFPLGFSVPSGFEVDGMFTSSVASVDIVKNLDDDPVPEYVLRLGMPRSPNRNLDALVETWRKMPRMELRELGTDGAGITLGRMAIGELAGYQAIVPSGEENVGWVVTGGVTDAPDGCEERALEVVEDILGSLRVNRAVVEPS